MSLLKLLWMYYRWLDPLGRVRRQPHWCSHCRVDGSYVSVRLRFEKSSPRWRIVGRERKSTIENKEPKKRNQQQQHGRPDRSTVVHQRAQAVVVDRPVDRRRRAVDCQIDRLTLPNSRLDTVDRRGRPMLGSVDRPVDRQLYSGCFRKVAELKISPIRILGFPWVYERGRALFICNASNACKIVLIIKSIKEISLPCLEDVGEIGRTSLNSCVCVLLIVQLFFAVGSTFILHLDLRVPLRGCCICAQHIKHTR